MKKTYTHWFAALTLVGSAAAFAGPGMKGMHNPMEAMDTDQNNEISKQEFENFQQEHFNKTDTDGDGQVTSSEFQSAMERARQERMQRHFERLDKDGNGSLSQQELQSRFQTFFEKCDQNNDDSLTRDEIKQCHHNKGAHKGMHKGQGDAPAQRELPPNRNL